VFRDLEHKMLYLSQMERGLEMDGALRRKLRPVGKPGMLVQPGKGISNNEQERQNEWLPIACSSQL